MEHRLKMEKKNCRQTQHFTHLILASFDVVGGEVGKLLEVGVFTPHRLSHHLGQLHGRQRRRQPTVAAQYVYARLDETDRLTRTQKAIRKTYSWKSRTT